MAFQSPIYHSLTILKIATPSLPNLIIASESVKWGLRHILYYIYASNILKIIIYIVIFQHRFYNLLLSSSQIYPINKLYHTFEFLYNTPLQE